MSTNDSGTGINGVGIDNAFDDDFAMGGGDDSFERQNEEKGPDEELVATHHRDLPEPLVGPDEEPETETAEATPREALDELAEE